MRGFSGEAIVILVLLGMGLLPATAEAQYVGARRCRPCHLPQFKSWEQTRMAKALELLKPGVAAESKRAHKLDPEKDYTSDPNCVQCHVTGYGQPGGFVSLEKTPKLVGVQCDACHGPGAGYLKPNLESFSSRGDFLAKATTYQLYFNLARPNSHKDNLTPWQIIQQLEPRLPLQLCLLTPVFLDRFLDSKGGYLVCRHP